MHVPLLPFPLSAGFPSPAMDWFERRLALEDLLIVHPDTTFFAYIKGHSMQEAGIDDGDLVVIDRALDATNGTIILARLGEEFVLKRLVIEDARWFLHAAHPDYPPIEVSGRDDFTVWGVITHVIRSFCKPLPHFSAKKVQ
jgi:DNA polymerase V